MRASLISAAVALTCLTCSTSGFAEEMFADDFDDGLSSEWRIDGLDEQDYRIRDGGLEMRVQPGKLTRDTPRLSIVLPFTASESVAATVEVTILDRFTEPAEFAGMYLMDENGLEFGARKQRINGYLVFSPGAPEFIGRAGEEGDPSQYAVKYWPANQEMGPLRIIFRGGHAHFQVGPSTEGEYATYFHSAINENATEYGFCLIAAGGPDDGEHWVRFDNFRVER